MFGRNRARELRKKSSFQGKQHSRRGAGGLRCPAGSCVRRGGRRTCPPVRSATERRRLGEIFFIYTYKKVPKAAVYFSGMKREEWVAPIPGRPCFTGL